MQTVPSPAAFLLVLLALGILYILADQARFNQALIRKQAFYTGNKAPAHKWSFWLPLFHYRRRRRVNGKKLSTPKNRRHP